MIWYVLLAWAVCGAVVAWRLVPWEARCFFVGSWRDPSNAGARIAGMIGVVLAFAIGWPCYLWLRFRRFDEDCPLDDDGGSASDPEPDHELIDRALERAGWKKTTRRTNGR